MSIAPQPVRPIGSCISILCIEECSCEVGLPEKAEMDYQETGRSGGGGGDGDLAGGDIGLQQQGEASELGLQGNGGSARVSLAGTRRRLWRRMQDKFSRCVDRKSVV